MTDLPILKNGINPRAIQLSTHRTVLPSRLATSSFLMNPSAGFISCIAGVIAPVVSFSCAISFVFRVVSGRRRVNSTADTQPSEYSGKVKSADAGKRKTPANTGAFTNLKSSK
jgi:hypothetical protein